MSHARKILRRAQRRASTVSVSELLRVVLRAQEDVFRAAGADVRLTVELPSAAYERLLAECLGVDSGPPFSTEFWYDGARFVRLTR